jgi:uracil-DNA glycosylase
MTGNEEVRGLLASLKVYLEDLRDSGVDGLPHAVVASSASPAGERKPEALEDIRADLGECLRCELGRTRNNLVFGVGTPAARIVFVGEAPGRDEDLQGEPFVGEAGQLLTKIIQAMGLERREVYICNVLKCRPPNNRNPLPAEIEQCHPFLLRQLKAIGPGAIVALGTFAAQTLLKTKEPISKLRGHFHDYHGIPLMPTFHPAFLLRNASMKREVWEDMQLVMKLLKMPVPDVNRQGTKA